MTFRFMGPHVNQLSHVGQGPIVIFACSFVFQCFGGREVYVFKTMFSVFISSDVAALP